MRCSTSDALNDVRHRCDVITMKVKLQSVVCVTKSNNDFSHLDELRVRSEPPVHRVAWRRDDEQVDDLRRRLPSIPIRRPRASQISHETGRLALAMALAVALGLRRKSATHSTRSVFCCIAEARISTGYAREGVVQSKGARAIDREAGDGSALTRCQPDACAPTSNSADRPNTGA